ncbi:anti-sigma factor family protein [Roseicyclus mahoneyensis]|uniref:Anti-sigma factor RsiW n=1 Tax=Roseicyclus mahoneyensis TaxID=164332 RepID=A0A316GFA4_9RHOB|nr:hypothetical protein [Roseicyclus mahoneyensis]PWK59611.1 anti-sigma factor RsiW [Roseicyclus mahoneyensis]
MTRPEDGITETELDAFLTGQLEAGRRFAVADHLARHPDLAARAMSDLRLREGLHLVLSQVDGPPPPALRQAADTLARGLVRPPRWPLRAAAAAALIALGWASEALWSGFQEMRTMAELRPLAETALDARDAVELRRSLALTTVQVDAAQIAERLGLDLPTLPTEWQVRDVQVVATPQAPGLALVIDTPDMGEVMLLSFLQNDGGRISPLRAFDHRGSAVAVFEHGPTAFVLLDASAGVRAEVSREAERLLSRMN